MLLDIENAKTYFLAPINTESKHLIGGLDEMNHLAHLMQKGDLIATTGVGDEECALIVTWDDDKCVEMLDQMHDFMKKRSEGVGSSLIDDLYIGA